MRQELIQIDTKGRVVLPKKARQQGYYTCQTESDGTIHLIPVIGILTAKQAYFWTEEWQKGEKEATDAIHKKNTKTIPPKKLKQYLDSL
jgi:DNA-binding transcriptional regulator/RsmH inhibitor MraZ